jgi:CubicO group peptidase (beta-lactamase class C family)
MATRRELLRAGGGMAATVLSGSLLTGPRPARADTLQAIQQIVDDYYANSLGGRGAHVGVVVGMAMPDSGDRGRFVFAGGQTLTNPEGRRLELNEQTHFEIGSISKVFTSGMYYMLHGPYTGTLRSSLGERLTMSPAVADISLKNLAVYRPGLAQDNQGGVYPPGMMRSLRNLFDHLAHFTPPFPQGTCYAYSNLGWSLLGMATVRLANLDTEAYADTYNAELRKFCRGFGATNTEVFHPRLKPQLPRGYTRRFVSLPPDSNYQPARDAGYASGGIVSTGADMMQFLLYNMGRLPGRLNDRALAYQQTDTLQTPPCSGAGPGPTTSYGWFHAKVQTPGGEAIVLNKNGGVAGFTSWMGFVGWQGTGAPSPVGAFVLSNSPASTRIGNQVVRLLLRG